MSKYEKYPGEFLFKKWLKKPNTSETVKGVTPSQKTKTEIGFYRSETRVNKSGELETTTDKLSLTLASQRQKKSLDLDQLAANLGLEVTEVIDTITNDSLKPKFNLELVLINLNLPEDMIKRILTEEARYDHR